MKLPSLEPESSASAKSATLAYSVFSDLIKIPCFLSKVKSLFKNIFEGLMESKNLCFPVDFGSTKNYFFLCSHPPILHAPPPSETDFPNITKEPVGSSRKPAGSSSAKEITLLRRDDVRSHSHNRRNRPLRNRRCQTPAEHRS